MTYCIRCACGNRTEVTESQAGTEIPCSCGRVVAIPRLSQLRKEAGAAAAETSPELLIRYSYGYGRKPLGGDACTRCHATPAESVLCFIECERPVHEADHYSLFWLILAVLQAPLALIYLLVHGETKVRSEGTQIEFHLALCASCRAEAPEADWLEDVVCVEPAFDRLFAKYPDAQIWVGTPTRRGKT